MYSSFTHNCQRGVGRRKRTKKKMKQFPVYFVSEALSGAKLNYSELEKIAYTVVMVSRK
jgi:hypothetical protein